MDGDISDFFGSLSHERLIDLVADRVADGKVLSLIRSMLTAGVLVDGVTESVIAGVPQGGVASPLLSNVYLTVFDQKMAEAGFALTRYADDCVPRTLKEESNVEGETDGSGAAREMKEPGRWPGGPSRPPCRGRPQTTARCAGQEPGC